MRSLDSVTFDANGLVLQGDEGNRRVWHTADGNPVTLYHFTKPSPMAAVPQNLDQWRARSRSSARESNGALIEVELRNLDGCAAVHDISKTPQIPFGMGYLGCIMLPFRDFGFMVTVACRETGLTGQRDTTIFAELMQTGEVKFEEGSQQPLGWMADPYDPSIATPPGRNRSDEEKYDARFPDHPLSQVRRWLRQIENSLRLSDEVKDAATVD